MGLQLLIARFLEELDFAPELAGVIANHVHLVRELIEDISQDVSLHRDL